MLDVIRAWLNRHLISEHVAQKISIRRSCENYYKIVYNYILQNNTAFFAGM
jgi:hypothetical protein